jgi:hypothetical protein
MCLEHIHALTTLCVITLHVSKPGYIQPLIQLVKNITCKTRVLFDHKITISFSIRLGTGII